MDLPLHQVVVAVCGIPRKTMFKEKEAFIALTDNGGCDLPESIEEPVMVGIYFMDD